MRLSKLFELEAALLRYERLSEAKLSFCLARNLVLVQRETDAYRKVTEATPAMKEFAQAKEELLEKHAERDDKNKAIRRPVQGVPGSWSYVLRDELAYEKDFEKLRKKHTQAVEDESALLEKRKELLDEDIEVPFRTFKAENLRVDDEGNMAISMRDLSIFLDAGIIVGDLPDEEEEDEDEDTEKVTPLPKTRSRKK